MQNIDNQRFDKKSIKIACTGGAGFVGSELIQYLNQQGYTNIDIFEKLDGLHNKWQNIAGLQFNNILDYQTLLRDDVYSQYQWLILLGANSATTTAKNEFPQTLFDNFTYPTELMGKIARNYNPEFDSSRRQKVIFASSAATYGLSNNFKERITDIKPSNFYGLTKLMVDRYMTNELFGKNHAKFYSFRFFNVVGSAEKHKFEVNMASPVSRFLAQEPPFILYRDEKQTIFKRDFVWVKDLAKVIFHTLTNDCPECICNIGSGIGTSWEELVKIVCEVRGLDYNNSIKYEPLPDQIKSHYQMVTIADLNNLRNIIGYKKEITPLKEVIKNIYETKN